jgi:hypothetical protein
MNMYASRFAILVALFITSLTPAVADQDPFPVDPDFPAITAGVPINVN